MAHIEDSGSEKNANVELNLVPFIDLMCVCITFLLITAVWTQVSMIQLGTSIYGKKSEEDLPIQKTSDIAFRLDVKDRGYALNLGIDVVSIPLTSEGHDQSTLKEELQKVRDLYPEKKDVVISMEDHLSYNLMIQTMDQLIQVGFVDVGIATGAVR